MATIRYVCRGHEYRYDTVTGDVRNNYGTRVSFLAICKLTGYALMYRADVPTLLFAKMAEGHKASDEALAQFAIGQTAVAIPEE